MNSSIKIVSAAIAAGLAMFLVASTAQAQSSGWRGGRDRGNINYSSQAYANGFRDGQDEGVKDSRHNRPFSFEDDKRYERADHGYHKDLGSKELYRRYYREGYASGYIRGYGGRDGRSGSYGGPRAVPRDNRRGSPWEWPGYPAPGRYPNGYPGRSGGYSRYWDIAFQNGYDEGYKQGIDDAEDGDRYDPVRHGRYRSADHGYNNRYGSKEEYRNTYREGFRGGYEDGYRDGRFYDRNRSRRGGWWN